jgi:large subunit ribosomal protein L25
VTREVEVECLPTQIPPEFVIDVTKLEVGDHFEAKDIALPEGVTLLTEGKRVIVSISHSRVAEEVEEAAAGVEGETLIEDMPDEPEVIRRGKDDDDEDEDDD